MKENNNTANIINAGGMSIKVTVTPMKEQEGCLKANASIILNDVFKVTGIRIGISQKGHFFALIFQHFPPEGLFHMFFRFSKYPRLSLKHFSGYAGDYLPLRFCW